MNGPAEVAQVVEHGTENAGVDSSTLSLGTSLKGRLPAPASGSGSVVEHLLAKERVVGSNPIFRSTALLFPACKVPGFIFPIYRFVEMSQCHSFRS